jgi:hypothetical protein
VDLGTNNIVQEYMPFYQGGVQGAILQRDWFNKVVTYRKDYSGVRTGAATPVGSVTPYYVGEQYIDTSGLKSYISSGLLNTNWIALN